MILIPVHLLVTEYDSPAGTGASTITVTPDQIYAKALQIIAVTATRTQALHSPQQ
jgi:streptogramin lyase